jgi:hypothetical protein
VYPDVNAPMPAETYRVVGVTIEFNPVPTYGTYTVKYVPVVDDLVADSDTLDGVLGWEEYIVVAVSIDVLMKEEGDPTNIQMLEGKLNFLRDRIKYAAQQEELSETPGIAKVRRTLFDSELPQIGDYPYKGYRGWFF